MNKVLFINLRRFGDIFSSAHIASDLKSRFKNIEVSILIFKATRVLNYKHAKLSNQTC